MNDPHAKLNQFLRDYQTVAEIASRYADDPAVAKQAAALHAAFHAKCRPLREFLEGKPEKKAGAK